MSDCVVFWIFTLQVLILFKLILLEKKVSVGTVCCPSEGSEMKLTLTSCLWFLLFLQVLFYVSPVDRLVGALMTVLSLFPGQKASSRSLNDRW